LTVLAVATVAAVAPAPSASADALVQVTHAATYEHVAVPRGAYVVAYTPRPVSGETGRVFSPMVTTAPDGLYVEASCGSYASPVRVPLQYVGRVQDMTQINFYIPNGSPPEPWGICMDAGDTLLTIYPAPGYGSKMDRTIVTVPAHPGLFAATNGAPAGFHRDTVTGATTSLSDCNADPSRCRPRTNGQPAELLLTVTGADFTACNPCFAGFVAVSLAARQGASIGGEVWQTTLSIVRLDTGLEQIRARLRADTAAGEYRIRVWNVWSGYAIQDLTVRLGAPT
jgi:hypothetical protein